MKKKDTNKTKTGFTNRAVAVLIENFQSQFRVFGEGLSIVREDLAAVKRKGDITFEELGRQRETMSMMKAKVDLIAEDIKIIKTDVAEIKIVVKVHDKRLIHLETAG